MESLNPFWWSMALISIWSAGIGLVMTLVAGLVWLFHRSRAAMIVFLVLLTATGFAGITFGISLLLMEAR